jgi:hypothetical protein
MPFNYSLEGQQIAIIIMANEMVLKEFPLE